MSSPDDWAEPLIKYGPSLSSEDQNSVADASLENYSYAEPGMGSSFTPATQSDTRAALLGVLDPNYHLLETEETDTTYKKSSAPQPPHGDIVTLVEPGPDVYVNKEPPAKSTFQIDQKADTVVSPFNKPTTPRSFSAAPKLKTQSFISAWQKRGTLEICQPSTSGIQRGFTCEGNTVKVSQQLEVGSGAGGAPTPPHPNGGTRKRASGNGGSKAFQELNELQAAKVAKNQTTDVPDYQISANDKGLVKIRQEKNTYRLIAPPAPDLEENSTLTSVQILNARLQPQDDSALLSLLMLPNVHMPSSNTPRAPNRSPANHVPQPQQPDIQPIRSSYIEYPKNNKQSSNLCNQRQQLKFLGQVSHALKANPSIRSQAPTFQRKSAQSVNRRPIKDAQKSSIFGQHQHLKSNDKITPALIRKLAIQSQEPVLQPFPAQLTNRPYNNPQTPTLYDQQLPPTPYGNPEPPDKAPDIRVHDHPSTIPTPQSNPLPVTNCQQISQTPSVNLSQPTPIIVLIPMILARGDQVQPTSPLVPLLRPQPCVYNGIGINVMQSIDKQATFTQARTEPGHLGLAARTSNRKRNQPKILPCTSNKDKMQERAKSFQRHLLFCMGFSRMVKPLADFGYKYIGQSFGNEQIQCDECLMKQKIPNVFKQNTRQVVWHHLGCHFSSAKKPCTKCVQPNTGLCRGCEECQ